MKYQTVISLIKNYRWRSFFVKYFFITFVPFLTLFLVISGILFVNNTRGLRETAEKQSGQVISNVSYAVDSMFNEANNSYHNIIIHEDIQYFLTISKADSPEFYKTVRDIQKYMSAFISGYDSVKSLYVYGKNSDYVLSSSSVFNSRSSGEFDDKECFFDAEQKSIFKRKIDSVYLKTEYLTVIKPLFYGSGTDGYFAANLDYQKITELIESNMASDYEVYIVNKNGDILFSPFKDKENISFDSLLYKSLLNLPENRNQSVTRDGNFIVTSVSLDEAELGVIVKTSIDSGGAVYGGNILNSVFILLVLFFAAVGISLLVTLKFYNSIFGMLEIIQGSSPVSNVPNKKDEINFINSSIASIIGRSNNLEEELAKRIALLNKTQAMSLQAQLNPHFIFNTIHLINTLEMRHHKSETEVTVAIKLLGDILRLALDTTETFITLDKEIEYSNKYLQIAALKYNNKFIVNWNIDENAKKLYVLKLFLQPILENAINHGLVPLKDERRLDISVKLKDKQLLITVSDNGKGMDEETLAKVRENMNSMGIERKSHLGLNNTNQRIKLIFGEDYGCTVYSGENGTKVEISIPEVDSLNTNKYTSQQ